jgi:hypothetical protein
MSRLEQMLAGQGDEESERQRKLAAEIAESRANTHDFVLAMRGRKFGRIPLYARLSSPPSVAATPAKRLWRPQPVVVVDTRPEHSYSDVGRGWAVQIPSSDGYTDRAFVIDNPDEPTVYKDAYLPSTSDSRHGRPDASWLEKPSLILHDVPHRPVREYAVVQGMFTGEYGLRLLANAVKAQGLPGF